MLITETGSLVTVRAKEHSDLLATAYSNQVVVVKGNSKVVDRFVGALVNCLEWNHEGLIGVGGEDGTVKVVSSNGDSVAEGKGHVGAVLACDWDVTGRLLVTGGLDECLCLWEPRASNNPIATIAAHSDPILSVSFNGDGYKLASASVDGLIRVWDVRASLKRCLATIIDDDNPVVSSVMWSPNDQYLVSASMDNAVRLWDYETKRCVRTYKGPKFGRIGRARLGRMGEVGYVIAAGGEDGLWAWNAQSKNVVIKPKEDVEKQSVLDFEITPDQVYYVNGTDGLIHSLAVKSFT